jgi:hypothetical protein
MGERIYRATFFIFLFFFTLALVGESSASKPYRCTPGEGAPSTHWVDGWTQGSAWTGLELEPLGRPARSQSLYQIRYPDSLLYRKIIHLFSANLYED